MFSNTIHNKVTTFLIVTLLFSLEVFAKPIQLSSPDRRLNITINCNKAILYTVSFNNNPVMTNCTMQMDLGSRVLGKDPVIIKQKAYSVNTRLHPEVPLKNSTVIDQYNALRIDLKGNYSIEFRAYNDGMAYRFITNFKDSVEVTHEDATFKFNGDVSAIWSPTRSFKCDYQIIYQKHQLKDVKDMSTLPVLLDNGKYKMLISEADLYDYPCMFLKQDGTAGLTATFPKNPLEFGPDGDRSVKLVKEASYIAKTNGSRGFPWRFVVITDEDKNIVANEMVYKLSRPTQIQKTDWIKPGQVTWEWWHNAYVYGVDFKSGYNQDTYKYYIDFASNHGIPYILMDEGWAKTTMNPYEPNPTINLHELIAYGKQKNVKIILWFTWLAVEENPKIFEVLHKWGIAGVKIDFMDRSDQWMVNYYTRVAKEAARYEIFVDFHGAFKPAGLGRGYPNVLSYEGVVGMEGNILAGVTLPDNNIYLPYIRNAVGPLDYTPGAMRSAHPKDYKGNWVNTMSIGTRAHQLSMYVVYESGLQMLADNPFNYLREPEATSFITSVPVTWDETVVIDGKVGEYVVMARRKGDKWFIGAMNNSKKREQNYNADFLKPGVNYKIILIKDGVNADIQAMDFKQVITTIKKGDPLDIKMEGNGGFVARIEPVK